MANLDKTTNLVVEYDVFFRLGLILAGTECDEAAPTTAEFQVNRGDWEYPDIDELFYIWRESAPLHGSILNRVSLYVIR